ncbi:hypothetical protein PGB90_002436 [Kerria lacca]
MFDLTWELKKAGRAPILSILVFVFVFVLITRYIWEYWKRYEKQRDKLKNNVPQKPVTLYRRPTPAVKSPATGATGTVCHYLKKSPSPTGLSPTSGGNSPSPTNPNQQKSPKDSPTSEETSGPSLAEESSSNTSNVENETSATNTKSSVENTTNKITTSQEILTGSLGQLFFNIRYKKEKEKPTLVVSVIKCQNLPAKDFNQTSLDPYVKLQLLPDKQHKVKTRVLRKTRNPVYEEDFSFYGIKINQLQSMILHFIVLTFDRYSRDEIIGEVFFPLNSIDIMKEEITNVMFQKDIQPRNLKVKNEGRGEILVSLCWQPVANRLTVVILKARNLPKMDVTGLADPYVKIYLTYKNQRIAKKKTHVKKRTLNPVFNESFVFEIPAGEDEIDYIGLEILLLDWDRVTKNEVIGRLEMGVKGVCTTAIRHWNDVRKSPRRQIADWHKLYE